ncbi:MAG: hypothetical protein KA368_13195 [Acidobacteria bacterium]|nr:hypothetical protein [Acidobacteriota bacterium]
MRLPDHIYNAIKPPFAHHATWHAARLPDRRDMRGPGTEHPDLKGINEAGSGEQFLRFHRDMVRVFRWIVEHTPGPQFLYTPWPQLPDWLAEIFETKVPGFLQSAYQEIDRLAVEGTADQLGGFIEATLMNIHPQRNIHNYTHREIADYEARRFGSTHPGLVDASMRRLDTAPHNEHFWGLHGWIDGVFARWQVAHGETVNQEPLHPDHSLHSHGHIHAAEIQGVIAPPIVLTPEEDELLFPSLPARHRS